jgi:hypothetical protein
LFKKPGAAAAILSIRVMLLWIEEKGAAERSDSQIGWRGAGVEVPILAQNHQYPQQEAVKLRAQQLKVFGGWAYLSKTT